MWRCPDCGREFKRKNQSHYCGNAPKTVEEYIQRQPEALQPVLFELREIIREAIPQAQECIKWSMATWYGKENILHFAVSSGRINLYVGKEAVQEFSGQRQEVVFDGGVIRIDPEAPLNKQLIREIVIWCAQE